MMPHINATPNANSPHITIFAQNAGQDKDGCHSVNLHQMSRQKLLCPQRRRLSFVCDSPHNKQDHVLKHGVVQRSVVCNTLIIPRNTETYVTIIIDNFMKILLFFTFENEL